MWEGSGMWLLKQSCSYVLKHLKRVCVRVRVRVHICARVYVERQYGY